MSSNQELKLLEKFEIDNKWLNSNYEELQTKHPNQYVAVFESRLVGHAQSVKELIEYLKSKKIDATFVLIEFVPEKGLKIIL